ncbi:GNAT family N-acetyltransferase [Fulvivirgaceae bacterium PWU5]|uniref:GNAT family N-acetyltransferase n=1 Tax=Dawidia cretensis TaxID=2782350 RepID=A0AAP2DSR0_9BACT|nr:GNAT family N-acetyltransferase [Dawidia cretensis]MBT1706820.1 GNAT family N-acetyltransferase [Dawidia cretensis]
MNKSYQIRSVKTPTEVQQCWEVVSLLRPHLNKSNWIALAEEMMQQEQYFIDGIFDNDQFVAFAGYRYMTTLHTGNFIYIDDLCTLESHRGKGLASLLLEHVKSIAIANNKDAVALDTDFTNNGAQKVYLKSGFKLAALHLLCDVRK